MQTKQSPFSLATRRQHAIARLPVLPTRASTRTSTAIAKAAFQDLHTSEDSGWRLPLPNHESLMPQEHPMLERVKRDIREYCDTTGTAECNKVYNWYVDKTQQLQHQCGDQDDSMCEPLEEFESTVRQLQGCGLPSLVGTLARMERVGGRQRDVAAAGSLEVAAAQQVQQRSRVEDIFKALGKRLDGHITSLEIQDAMPRVAGKHLSDAELEVLIEALEGEDMHFGLTLEECTSILETMAQMDEGSDAHFLAHLPHSHHRCA